MIKIVKKLNRYKDVAKDIILNLMSNIFITSIIQLVVFPLIARKIGNDEFGYVVSIYGVNNVIVIFLGNTLNNVRLLNQSKEIDYSLLAMVVNVISAIFIVCISFFYRSHLTIVNTLLFAIFTILSNNRAYTSVYYRINLQYNRLLYLNFCIIIGYIIGIFAYIFSGIWTSIFLIGEIFGFIYMTVTKNEVLFEFRNLKHKSLDITVLKQFIILSLSNSVSTGLNYLDRFIIVPILGAYNMAIFYAASSVSKVITMVVTPMTNVLLSYITQSEKKINKSYLLKLYLVSFISIVPFYFIMNFLSNFVVDILYPSLSYDAKKLIPLVSIGILVNTICSLLNPFILKAYSLTYQTIIQFGYGGIYILCAVLLGNEFGIKGFSLAYAIAMITKLIIQIIVVSFGKLIEKEE